MTSRPELLRLSKPFPAKFVAKKEGADYVNHAVVQQRLLGTVGPFDMRVDHVIRGPIAEKVTGRGDKQRTWPAAENAVVGVVLTCTFTIDGERVEVSEVGTPEGYYMAAHDGERLKKAMSDALKRCAMRVGVGLDLWSKGAYVLPKMLEDAESPEAAEEQAEAPDHDAPDPDDAETETPEEPADDGPDVEHRASLDLLDTLLATAAEAGVAGDADGVRSYARQSPGHAVKAVESVRDKIAAAKPAEPGPDVDAAPESPVEVDGAWRTVAEDMGVPPVAVVAALVKSWPSNDQAARPNNLKDVDRLAAKDEYRDLVRATIEDIAQERQAAS